MRPMAAAQATDDPVTAAKPEARVVAPVRHRDAEAQRNSKPKPVNNAATLDRMRAGMLKRAANSEF